jgi:mRNA-degrading endonuclease HigB of HigAB toxin-antitoxin module
VYEVAPEAVKVTVPAAQRVVGVAVIEIDGAEFTFIVMVSFVMHPEPLSAVTV